MKVRLKWRGFVLENKWKEWLSFWKQNKRMPNKNQLLILLLLGILFMVIAYPIGETTKEEGTTSLITTTQEEQESYEATLERKLEAALQYVEGVGKTKVVITLKSSAEKIIEKDEQSQSNTVQEEDSQGGTRVSQDNSFTGTSVYQQGEDGIQSPYVSKELTPEIEGVLVIAQGGDNAVTVKNITEAVQALFGIEAHKIKIMKRADT